MAGEGKFDEVEHECEDLIWCGSNGSFYFKSVNWMCPTQKDLGYDVAFEMKQMMTMMMKLKLSCVSRVLFKSCVQTCWYCVQVAGWKRLIRITRKSSFP